MSTTPVTISISVIDNNSAATLGKVQNEVAAIGAAGTAASAGLGGLKTDFDQVGTAGTKMAGQFRDASRTVTGAAHEMGIGVNRFLPPRYSKGFPA